jgi:hypothetical protein
MKENFLSTLSADEEKRLTQLEETISQGMLCFVEVGRALMAIRDERLYRQTHRTFQAYCLEKWEFGRAYAYRLIASAEVADNLSPIRQQITSESQLRPLTHLKPEEQKAAWQKAVESVPDGKKVTAKCVEDAVNELEQVAELGEAPDEASQEEDSVQLGILTRETSATVKKLAKIFKAANEEDKLRFLQWAEINYKELFAQTMWTD